MREEERLEIFNAFYNYDTKNEQDIHLQRLIEWHPIKRRRPRAANQCGEQSKVEREATYTYFVITHQERLQVCRKAFISLHGITQKRVFRIAKLLAKGERPVDKRGFNKKTHAISREICSEIRNHILKFPIKTSHYGGKEVNYLDARLNLKVMHNLFCEEHPNLKVKYTFYVNYFNKNFGYRFGRPQIDVCSTCEELQVKMKSPHLSQNIKLAAASELTIHMRRSRKFYSSMKSCSESCQTDDTVCVAFDFMQNLPLPHIPVQEIFYLRQLWVHVFTIHNLQDNSSKVYMYHEGQAKKGANEVCTFILDYLTNEIKPGTKKLHLYSDACPGQNRNHSFIRFCMGLVEDKRFEEIIHRFPIRGHSFLPCDRDFGVFKKKIKCCDRIYTPKEYCTIIANAKRDVTVKMVEGADVIDVDTWWPKHYRKTTLSDESTGKNIPRSAKVQFAPASFSEFHYSAEHPGRVVARPFIGSLVHHTFHLSQPGPRNAPLMNHLRRAYEEGRVPIKSTKLDDLKKLHCYVTTSEESKAFFDEVLEWPCQ